MALGVVPLLALALVACGREPPPPQRFEAGRLGRVELLRPNGCPGRWSALVGRERLVGGVGARSAAVGAEGAAVIGVDLPVYLAGLRASNNGSTM